MSLPGSNDGGSAHAVRTGSASWAGRLACFRGSVCAPLQDPLAGIEKVQRPCGPRPGELEGQLHDGDCDAPTTCQTDDVLQVDHAGAVRSELIQTTMPPGPAAVAAFAPIGSLNKTSLLVRSRNGTLRADTISSTHTTAARMLLDLTRTPTLTATAAAYTGGVPACAVCHNDDTIMCCWLQRIVHGRGLSSRVQPRACRRANPPLCTAARARPASCPHERKMWCSTVSINSVVTGYTDTGTLAACLEESGTIHRRCLTPPPRKTQRQHWAGVVWSPPSRTTIRVDDWCLSGLCAAHRSMSGTGGVGRRRKTASVMALHEARLQCGAASLEGA